jgi:hypothetical protein
MARGHLRIAEETGAKKAFAWAVDWPGWARSGKSAELARAALLEYAPRYAVIAAGAGLEPPDVDSDILDVVESVPGGSGTDFGVPSAITDADRQPVDAADAERLADLVAAAWTLFDRVAAAAPESLRKGPRCRRRGTSRHARGPSTALGRRPARGPEVDPALRRATDRVARARSRVGDGGPLRNGLDGLRRVSGGRSCERDDVIG